MSSANLVVMRYVKEVTAGVTPATPALKNIRFTGESLNFAISNTTSTEIRPDRAQSDLVQTDANAAGDVNFELSYLTFDDFLSGALCDPWSAASGNTRYLENGVTDQFFTVQKHFTDIPLFHNFKGCVINQLELNLAVGAILTGRASFMGMDVAQTASQFGGATITDAPTTEVMNAVADVQDIIIDDVPYSGCVSTLTMLINNNYRARKCIGTLGSTDMIPGTREITGTMNLYFSEGSMYEKFLEGTEFSYSFKVESDDGSYTFRVPRAKFETAEVVAGGQNTDVMINATWRALFDGSSGRMIQIEANTL